MGTALMTTQSPGIATVPEWTAPTMVEMMQAEIAVLQDSFSSRFFDAIFVHAPALGGEHADALILDHAVALQKDYGCPIVINGLTEAVCKAKTIPYTGVETWHKTLVRNGIPESDIILLPPSHHTGQEVRNLIMLAKEKGWTRIAIVNHALSQLRSFLTMIAVMNEIGYPLSVYNRPCPGIPWNLEVERPVLNGKTAGGAVAEKGIWSDLISGELQRIIFYSKQAPLNEAAKPTYTRSATPKEMFEYLDQRG